MRLNVDCQVLTGQWLSSPQLHDQTALCVRVVLYSLLSFILGEVGGKGGGNGSLRCSEVHSDAF